MVTELLQGDCLDVLRALPDGIARCCVTSPCILAGSAVGDTVLDPFMGSGTTGAVAYRLGRSFVGIELSTAYLGMARKRIDKETTALPFGEESW